MGPFRSYMYVHYQPTSWQLEDMESEIFLGSYCLSPNEPDQRQQPALGYDLWLLPRSLSAFRCRCYSPYTAICDGTLLKFHPHKY